MNFPSGASTGNCVPDSTLRMGCIFRQKLQRKVHLRIQAQSGTRFPDGMGLRKLRPSFWLQNGIHFPERSTCGGIPTLLRGPLVELRYS